MVDLEFRTAEIRSRNYYFYLTTDQINPVVGGVVGGAIVLLIVITIVIVVIVVRVKVSCHFDNSSYVPENPFAKEYPLAS